MEAQTAQSAEATERAADQHRRIDIERVHLLFRQSFWGILGSLINALLLAFLLRHLIDRTILITWLLFNLLLVVTRAWLIYRFKRLKLPPERLMRWRRYNILTLAASGLIWGSASFFLFPLQSVPHQFYLATILSGMVAGAAMAFAAVMGAFLAFAIPSLLPLAFRFLTIPGELHTAMAFLALIYLTFSILIARNLRRTRTELLLLKEDLAQRVAQRTQALSQSNRQLQAEIEERAQMQERLRQERDRLESITASMGLGLVVISREYRIIWANRVLTKMFGDVEGKPCHEIYKQYKDVCPDCGVRQIFEQDQQEVVIERKGRDDRGNLIWSQIIATPIRDAQGQVTAALEVVMPITRLKLAELERRRMASQLEEARKFEAVATLAGGIAHQFNNALTVIFGNIELLNQDGPAVDAAAKYINPVQAAASRMSRLTDQLLAYAKGGKYKSKWVDLRLFLGDALEIAKHDLKPEIEITCEFKDPPPEINIDPAQMQMVISAIIANAAEAIPSKGRIQVKSRNARLEERTDTTGDLPPGLYARLSITDNGAGMDAATLQRIFEPFFSTKFQGRGLAMAAVLGIIKNHGGHIWVASEPGHGTTVSILLPAREAAPVIKAPASAPAAANGSGITVLLIEDEDMVREINHAILKRLGYTVIEAATGQHAKEVIASQPVDLVLLDIKLPDMDGSALFPFIKEHCPQCRVIICSGYALGGPAQSLMDAGAEAFVQKPFSMSTLSAKIKEAMARK